MTCSFVPPYLLRAIADRAGSEHACVAGQSTLSVDEQLRSRRAFVPDGSLTRAGRATVLPSAAALGGNRVVHSAGNLEVLPGEVARRELDPPTGDLAVDEAHDSSGVVLELFATEFDRDSADGAGGALSITVHYGQNYDNAFWDGSQLVFGDGDGEIFERFTKPMDVMAHEFAHAVTQFTAGLNYEGQSGALNESVSDVFAAMAKQRLLGQTADQADWLIGEGIFRPGVSARALRSMIEPGTAYDDPQIGRDPQVGSMADYVETTEDNGGVHINSGIPNRAFALVAQSLGGLTWERAGQVWYDALTAGEVTARSDFAAFAAATMSSAERRFPNDRAVADAVRAAWTTVGVLETTPATPPASPPAEPDPMTPPASGPPETPLPVAPTVAVRRTGGFTGIPKVAKLDLDQDPQGEEVRSLLTRVELQQLSLSGSSPDGFVYTVEYGEWQVTVPERDLTPELHRVVQLVLDPSRHGGLELPE